MSGRHEAFFRAQRERDDREQERREYCAMEEKVTEQSDAIAELVEAAKGLISALRVQARMAARFGGEIALNEGSAKAWMNAERIIAKHKGGQDE